MVGEVLSELLGTLLFFTCYLTFSEPTVITVIALAIMGGVCKVLGGHLNPAYSCMKYVKGDINRLKLVAFISAQLIGAMAALALWWYIIQHVSYTDILTLMKVPSKPI